MLMDQTSSTEHGVSSRRVSATLAATTGSATNNYTHWPRTTSTNFALNYKVTPADCGTGQNTTRSQLVMSRHSTRWQLEDSTEMLAMTRWTVTMEWCSRPMIVTMVWTVHCLLAEDSGITLTAATAWSMALVNFSHGLTWTAILTTCCVQVECGLLVSHYLVLWQSCMQSRSWSKFIQHKLCQRNRDKPSLTVMKEAALITFLSTSR